MCVCVCVCVCVHACMCVCATLGKELGVRYYSSGSSKAGPVSDQLQ